MSQRFKAAEHKFIHEMTGIDLGDYEVETVLARHNTMIPIVCSCLTDAPHTDKGQKLKDLLKNSLDLNLHDRSSKVILGWIDMARKGNPDGVAHAKKLLDFAHDNFLDYNRTESAANRGPSVMESTAATAQSLQDQYGALAKQAQAKLDQFTIQHQTLYAIVKSGWDTFKDLSVFKDCYDLYKDTNLFLKSISAQESVAAASAVLSPIGPGAVALCMAGEFLTLQLMFLNVVTELIGFFEKLATGDAKQIAPVLAGTSKAKDIAATLNVKKTIEGYRQNLHDVTHIRETIKKMGEGMEELAKAGKWIHAKLHGST